MKRVESIYHLLILDYNLFDRMWNRGYRMRGGRLCSRDTKFWYYGQKLYVQLTRLLRTPADIQQPGEKRYLLATGAELQDIDIISQPLQSSTDFSNRIATWLKEVDEHEGGRDKALVGFFGQVKKNVIDSGKDFVKLVEGPCRRYGILSCVKI